MQNNSMYQAEKNNFLALFTTPQPQASESLFGECESKNKKNSSTRTNRRNKNKGNQRIY